MNINLTLYAYPFRSRAERVLWTLKELDLDVKVVRLSPFVDNQINPELLKLNPEGKVPVLIHNDKVLLESLAIMEYLNSLSVDCNLIPIETANLYEFRRILHYGLTEIEPYLWLAEQAEGPLSNLYHWPNGVYKESIDRVGISCKVVESFLDQNNYLINGKFTIADIYYYHILTWAKQHGIFHAVKIENYLSQLETRRSFPKEMHWKN